MSFLKCYPCPFYIEPNWNLVWVFHHRSRLPRFEGLLCCFWWVAESWTSFKLLQGLCKLYPSEFMSYFHYVRSLRFEDKPDYSYLKRLFRDLFIREGNQLCNTVVGSNLQIPNIICAVKFSSVFVCPLH